MATTPNFTLNPSVGVAALAAANTNRDGTGTIVTLVTSNATTGTKVNEVRIKATGTTTDGMVRFFQSVDSGTTWRLIHEIPVLATVPSASVPSFAAVWNPINLEMGLTATHLLGVTTHNAEAFHVVAYGGSF